MPHYLIMVGILLIALTAYAVSSFGVTPGTSVSDSPKLLGSSLKAHSMPYGCPSPGQTFFPGLDIARDITLIPGQHCSGYILDGYGGLHPFGTAPGIPGTLRPYWAGFDIAKAFVMINTTQGYILDGWGGIHPVNGATPIPAMQRPYWPGFNIARDLDMINASQGYVLDGWGGVHPVGGATAIPSAERPYYGVDIAQDIEMDSTPRGYILRNTGQVDKVGAAAVATWSNYGSFGFNIARDLKMTDLATGKGHVLEGFAGVHPLGGIPSASISAYFGQDRARAMDFEGGVGFVVDGNGNLYQLFN